MKILYFLDGLNRGGVEIIVTQLANYFFNSTNEVHVVYLYKDLDDLKGDLNPNIFLHPLQFDHQKKSYCQYYNNFKELVSILKKIRPDIIHAHNSSFSYYYLSIAVRFAKINAKNVRTLHFMGFFLEKHTIKDKIRFFFDRKASELLCSVIVSVSPLVQKLAEDNYPLNQLALINNGVDIQKIIKNKATRSELGISEHSIVGVYTSRICEGKNHKTLLQSWIKIVKIYPNALLILIGDGPLKKECETFCSNNGIKNNVLFTGSISNVAEYLSIADIGIFPSESEGLSLGLCEMMSAKLPVVISDIPSFRAIINDGENGIFFRTYDFNDLTDKILMILSDKEKRSKLSENAFNLVIGKYSMDIMLQNYDKIYHQILI